MFPSFTRTVFHECMAFRTGLWLLRNVPKQSVRGKNRRSLRNPNLRISCQLRHACVDEKCAVASLPVLAPEILHLLQEPEVSAADLRRWIEFAPGLTPTLLRWAKTACLGGRGVIENVHGATVRPGLKRVYHVVTASVVAPMARRQSGAQPSRQSARWRRLHVEGKARRPSETRPRQHTRRR